MPNFFEFAGVDRIEFAAGRIVDGVEQRGKGLTQIEAAAATMANVEYPAHFLS